MKEKLIGLSVMAVLFMVRALVLWLPDRLLGLLFRALARLVYAATADDAAAMPVAEIADIFECGPPFTDTVRNMLRNAEPELAASSVICLTRRSPHGAL